MSQVTRTAVSHAYPLSPLQAGMLFHEVYSQNSCDYQEQVVFKIMGSLDSERLTQAFVRGLERHEMLRSAFVWQGQSKPVGVVFKPEFTRLPVQCLDWSRKDRTEQIAALKMLLAQDHEQGYELKRPPLARIYLIELGQNTHYCVFCHHHLILDGWSLAIFLREVLEAYESEAQASHAELSEAWTRYRAHLAKARSAGQAPAWRAFVGKAEVGTALPEVRRVDPKERDPQEIRIELAPAQREAWQAGCQRLRITPSVLTQAAYALALGRATQQRRVGLGVTMSGRPASLAGTQSLVGLLINTLPLVVDLDPTQSSHAYLEKISTQNLWLQDHQCAPLSDVQQWVGQSPLFETVVVYDNYPIQSLLDASKRASARGALQTVALQPAELEALGPQAAQRNHYPLTLVVMPGEETWWLGAAFDAKRLDPVAVQSLLQSVADFGSVLVDKARPLGEIAWADVPQPSPWSFCPPARAWSDGSSEHSARAAVVERSGMGRRELSWGELNAAVERVGAGLMAKGVKREARVVLDLERGLEWIVCFLGIQKAGACAVPVDPQTPLERKQTLMRDCGAVGVISQSTQDDFPCAVWTADALDAAGQGGNVGDPAALHPELLAYILYTSGSTGAPKGVAVSCRNWAAYAEGFTRALGEPAGRCFAWLSGSAVDLGHSSILGALWGRGTLVVVRPDLAGDPDALSAALRQEQVEVMKLAPTHLTALLDAASDPGGILPSQVLVSGGEAMSASLLQRISTLRPGCRVFNHYGPTETTVGVAMQMPCRVEEPGCIGDAMPHARLTVRDPWGQTLPAGLKGELWIAGASVARGYFGDPRKTAQSFVPDPDGEGARAYRSGDAVIRNGFGLCFQGRIDRQLKIRGFRVEPAELEAWLRNKMQVRAAVAFAEPTPPGTPPRHLWAVVVPGPQTPEPSQIQATAQAQLPTALVPAKVQVADELPLLASGKIDRARVLKLAQAPVQPEGQPCRRSPEDPRLQTLAQIWSTVLKREVRDLDANFFSLGGDSILSLQVVARAKKAGISMLPKDLFENPTLSRLVAALTQSPRTSGSPKPKTGQESWPKLPSEHWLAEQSLRDPEHFYQSMMVPLRMRPKQGDFARAMEMLCHRHRAMVGTRGDDWEEVQDWSRAQSAISARVQALSATLGRDGVPGLRIICFVEANVSSSDPEHPQAWLACLAHHRWVDAVSWRILLRELGELLAGETLSPIAVDGRALAHALGDKVKAGDFDQELEFWRAQTQEGPKLSLGAYNCDYQEKTILLDAKRSQRLRTGLPAAHRAGVQEALLCAWSGAMASLGRGRTVVELEGHGRSWCDDLDTSGTVAWCTARYPLALDAVLERGARLSAIQDKMAAVPGDGTGYGALRYLSEHQDALAKLERLDLTLNYLGQTDRVDLGNGLHPAGLDPALRPDLGEQRCPHWRPRVPLRITASLRDEQLSVRLNYDPQRWPKARIDALTRALTQELEAVSDELGTATPVRWHRRDLEVGQGDGPDDLDGTLAAVREMGAIKDVFLAAPSQVGLWLQDQIQQRSGDRAYWNQLIVCWSDLQKEPVIAAFVAIARHYSALRTAFCAYGERSLLQVELQDPQLPIHEVELSCTSQEREAADFATLVRMRPLLSSSVANGALPWEVVLARGGQGRLWLAFSRHHILLDGWSTARLLSAFAASLQGRSLPSSGRPYRDYVRWVYRQQGEDAQAFWRTQLQDCEPMPAKLGHDCDATPKAKSPRVLCEQEIGQALVDGLVDRGAGLGMTLNLWCQAAWGQVLSMYSGRKSVVFGIVDSGRHPQLAQSESIIGLMMQTLPLVLTFDPAAVTSQWLEALRDLNLKMRRFGAHGLDGVHRRLWQSLLVFENYPLERELDSQLGQLLSVQRLEETHYPLTLSVDALQQTGQGVKLSLRYDPSLYDAELAQGLLQSFVDVLRDLSRRELQAPLYGLGRASWNGCAPSSVCASESLVQRFFAMAQTRAEAVALVQTDGTTLSYAELAQRVQQVAAGLRARGIGAEDPVGINLPRSIDLVVASLAVLAAGGYYVPIDPELPELRQQELIRTAGLRGLISEASSTLCWSLGSLRQSGELRSTWPAPVRSQLAYQIFTSGSTGTPKGVGVEHHQVLRLLDVLIAPLELDASDTWTFFHRHAFDVSVWEIFGALCTGAKLVIIDEVMQRDPARYAACLRDQGVTVASETPSAYYLLQEAIAQSPELAPKKLRCVMFAGEALEVQRLSRWPFAHPQLRFWDLYGNTETTVHATLGEVRGVPHSVGRALKDSRIEVLDAQGQAVPARAIGEICISGPGVTRGYLGDPRATAQRFVPCAWGPAGSRCYRTGDLGSKNDQGDLFYAGRVDRQVQLRGFRIELAEVEARLGQALSGQRVRLEMLGHGPTARLVAFVEDPAAQVDTDTLKAWCLRSLPDYQRPAQFYVLPRFAMTPNGKLDRAWLLAQREPEVQGASESGERSSQALAIDELWAQVLEIRDFGRCDVHQSFFALGGHSLLAVSLLNRFYERFGVRVELAEFLRDPSRAYLLQRLDDADARPESSPSADALLAMLDEIETELS